MPETTRLGRLKLECPEGNGETELLLEWAVEGDRDVLNSAYCKNPLLSDLSGSPCEWSCWENLIEESGKTP